VQYSFEKDIREKVGPIVVPVGRSVIGVVFGVVLSMIGIGIAWSLFIFFGFESIDVWKGLLYFGAGFGAGTGAFVAWLHLDRENGWVLLLMAAVVVGAGVVGSFGGFQYGEAQEVRCCAQPTVSPLYYTALGASVVANVAGVVFAATRAFMTKRTADSNPKHSALTVR
tara:strand:- start:692 stop:1195 length:504 start_codon:yes stop_codon:yes gene_type:complete